MPTDPLTDADLAAIARNRAQLAAEPKRHYGRQAWRNMGRLLAEVARLRAIAQAAHAVSDATEALDHRLDPGLDTQQLWHVLDDLLGKPCPYPECQYKWPPYVPEAAEAD